MSSNTLSCLVTGASRGIGRGIALELALAGHKVYITGRSENTINMVKDDFKKIASSCSKVQNTSKSGVIIPLVCDHSVDTQVDSIFKQIESLDVLVNNAYSAVEAVANSNNVPFHEQDISMWDSVNNVGLRNHYRCSHLAANKFLSSGSKNVGQNSPKLIVFVSSVGGAVTLFNTAYGIGKEANDRMAQEIAHDLRKTNIFAFSLWPGAVKTELIGEMTAKLSRKSRASMNRLFENGESTRHPGRCLAGVLDKLTDKAYMKSKVNGKVLLTSDLAKEFSISDIDGRTIRSMFSIKQLLNTGGYGKVAMFVPAWLTVPKWVFVLNRFLPRFSR